MSVLASEAPYASFPNPPMVSEYKSHFHNTTARDRGRPTSAPPGTLFTPRESLSSPSSFTPRESSYTPRHHEREASYTPRESSFTPRESFTARESSSFISPPSSPLPPRTPRQASASSTINNPAPVFYANPHTPTTPRVFPLADPNPPTPPPPPAGYAFESPIFPRPLEAPLSPTQSRGSQYNWASPRNPLTDGENTRPTSGRKLVPTYFDHLDKLDADSERLSRKQKPEPTAFFVDPSRAGIPTLIQRVRTREEDLFYPRRPSTAPARDSDIPAAGAPLNKTPGRRPCQIEKFNVRRNPLIDSGEMPPSRRTIIGFNKESDNEVQYSKRTPVTPPSLTKVSRTTDYFIPGEMPSEPQIRLRTNVPDDSDVFNHSHPLVSPHAPVLKGALDRERDQKVQEEGIEKAHQDRVSFYNEEIRKFKLKSKLKGKAV